MAQQTIAVDIDDVIADNAGAFIAYSNKHFGMKLTAEDYSEQFATVWQTDDAETHRRTEQYHSADIFMAYKHDKQARDVLTDLAQRYKLIVLTSRRSMLKEVTLAWVEQYYPGVFSDIQFSGFYDDETTRLNGHAHTKGDLLKAQAVDYFIDDQPKHCFSAAEHGIETILFGDYPWNRNHELPPHVSRCLNWPAVKEYFEARTD